jgi:glycine cleavage system H protein
MSKWRTVRVKQELVTAAKRTLEEGRYQSLSQFVSEAIRMRLSELEQRPEKVVEKKVEYPLIEERLLYTPKHMWVMATPRGDMKVGLSHYAQERLKGIASIQVDPVGCEVKRNVPFGVVETWMFMFDLYSPISGRIAKANKALSDEPFMINEDPSELAWIVEIKPHNMITLEEELRDLMKIGQYRMWLLEQTPRILGV